MRYVNKTMSPEAALRDLSHENPQARVRAADALGKVGAAVADRACPALRGLLSDDNPDVRYTAALSLGEFKDKQSVEALVDVVEGDGHPMPRQAAVIALGMIGDPRATRALTEALRSAPPDVRFQATTSLAEVNPKAAVGPLRRALKDAYYVAGISTEVERAYRQRLGTDSPEELTPTELLARYLESKKVSPDRVEALLEYAQEIVELRA